MKPTAAILSVGNEVLRGSVVNTNAAFLGRELSGLGFEVISHGVCADSMEAIRFRLGEVLRRVDLVIMMGGLGPTPDDVTREGIAAHFKVPLVFSARQYGYLEKVYKRYGKRVPPLVRREAFYPENAKPLVNRFGIALGFSIETGSKIVIALPGVPAELQNMYFDVVLPLLKKKYGNLFKGRKLIVRMTGISEPDVMKRLGKDFFDDPFDFGIYPSAGEIAIRILAEEIAILGRLKKKITTRLKNWIYGWDETPLSVVIGKILTRKKQTLAVVESCTGGLLASRITACPGSSAYFRGGVVAYHADVKTDLGVPGKLIKEHGEVSAQVASQLARSVRARMGSSFGIGITGVAGPDGGSPRKPVGLVYIGLASPDGTVRTWKHVFWGERHQIQDKAATKALEYLWRKIC
ncbi:MAG: CinA family nicotinamide mononucleotide deamidase-related protein [Candidatus Omnitrophica bacterium]|nr:CinA family nicotinamide mononucleotide deamidase-related protein [Candidatus Omnitrophota bacterium]